MDKRITLLMMIFFLVFTLFISLVIFNEPLSKFTRASEEYTKVSTINSKIIYYPTIVKADGKSSAAIQVFLMSLNSTPLLNKRVRIESSLGTIQEGEQSKVTEGHKYYLFHVISSEEGVANIEVILEGSEKLTQKISIRFIK